MQFTKAKLEKFLFFDIETSGQHPDFQDFVDKRGPEAEEVFTKKSKRQNNGKSWTSDPHADYAPNVPISPEFGRVVCLSYGIWKNGEMQIASVADEDEKTLLKKVANLFHRAGANGMIPTGWNIKNFDVPWLVRRMLINGVQVPDVLSSYEKKPWEMSIFDLKEYWRCGSTIEVNFEEACFAMGVPSPKDDIDGSQVHGEFWKGNISRITTYCEKDVKAMIVFAEKIYQVYTPETVQTNVY